VAVGPTFERWKLNLHHITLTPHHRDLLHPDTALGVKYYLKAAQLGNADALDRMAKVHQYGEFEQPLDLTASFRYYEKAADRGQCESMLNLSKMYLEGQAVEPNEALAFKWCERSAASGYDHAEFALGYVLLTVHRRTNDPVLT
jgi:uncharacterized protein